MKLAKLISALALAGAILACSLSSAPSTPGPGMATIVAGTLQALTTPVAPAPTGAPAGATSAPAPTQPAGTQVTFGNVSFVIPAGLASGASSETVPAADAQSGGPWDAAPAFTQFTLQAYPLQNKFFQPQIMVYPAQAYAGANNGAAISIQRLQAILANPSETLSNDVLPRLPFANAEQGFAALPKIVAFNGGQGVRVLAIYAQYFASVNNHDLIYHFEGLTSDGKYYIVAVLPINASFLAIDSDPNAAIPPNGVPFPGAATDAATFSNYYQAVASKFSATPPDALQPTLTALDALIQSLQISP